MHLEIGNLVQLKSGGPLMTVHSLIGYSEVEAVWFDNNICQRFTFHDLSLNKITVEAFK